MDARTGLTSIYYQITFEMVERGTGVIVWSGTYSFKKTALDDIIYGPADWAIPFLSGAGNVAIPSSQDDFIGR